ncbi:MAG: hypothetical protein D6730_02610 [Bacteroidetes bacterium]|nr:MAG: hypothetical protein D6730_02610 [Bacteroidota bacterium]
MNVFMTIHTGSPLVVEGPAVFLLTYMAGKTGGGQVGTFKWEVGFLMFFHCKQAIIKSVFKGMAFYTIRRLSIFHKLSLVIIRMTVTARCKIYGIRKTSLVAFLTFYSLMFPF